MQLVINERATQAQREALEKILTGQESEDMATMWWVFGAMSPNKLPTVYHPIDFNVDIEARRGRAEAAGVATITGQPIRNPVTGDEHRVRIDFPQSFEFRIAEIGSASSKTSGPIAIDLNDTYGQFAELHLRHKGRLN